MATTAAPVAQYNSFGQLIPNAPSTSNAGGIIGASGEVAPTPASTSSDPYQRYLSALNANQWFGVKPTPMTAAQFAAYTKKNPSSLLGSSATGGLGAGTDPMNAAVFASMTPAQTQQYNTLSAQATAKNNGGFWDTFNKVGETALIAIAAGETGGAAGAAAGGGILGGVVGGAAGGATGAEASSLTSNASLATPGQLAKGAVIGGVSGGLGAAATPATSALSSATGLSPALSSGIVKGAIGAGTNALGTAMKGGNVGNAALSGGVNGFISGAVGNATGSNFAGSVAGKLGTGAVGSFLGGGAPSNGAPSNGAPARSTTGSNFIGAGIGAGALSNSGGNIGNIGNMASTDQTLASTFGGAVPGLLQGAAGVYGSQNAAEKMTQADQNAINTQTSTMGNINGIWDSQRQLGLGANDALGTALGTNGKPADYSGFMNTPGYQFAVQQGTQAIQRQAASMGNAYTPNTAAAVGQYVTGTASQNYNNYISQLMGAAGLGSTANAGVADPMYKTGTNISQLQQNQGQAQASGVSGGANAVGGIFGPNGAGTNVLGSIGAFAGRAAFGVGGGSPAYGGPGYSDPFSGTDLARGNYTNYNMNNGPTSGDIGNLTNGSTSGDYGVPAFDPNSVTDPSAGFDTGGFDTGGFDPSIFSDRRLKTNIKRLGRIESGLNIYSFSYLWDTAKTCVGCMADEVMKMYPHAVGERGGYLTVNYSEIPV